jgi:hypothetical protein
MHRQVAERNKELFEIVGVFRITSRIELKKQFSGEHYLTRGGKRSMIIR